MVHEQNDEQGPMSLFCLLFLRKMCYSYEGKSVTLSCYFSATTALENKLPAYERVALRKRKLNFVKYQVHSLLQNAAIFT